MTGPIASRVRGTNASATASASDAGAADRAAGGDGVVGSRSRGGSRSRPTKQRRLPNRRRRARRDRLRRWAAASLAGLAAFVVVIAVGSDRAAETGVPTLVAAHDLPAGTVLAHDDLELATRLPGGRPATGLTAYGQVVGQVTAGPISARDEVTPERLVGPGLLAGQPAGHVALTLPVLGGGATGIPAGSHVDVYATGSGAVAAQDVVVLALSEPASSGFGPAGGTLGGSTGPSVTLALAPADARRVATALSALQAGDSFVLALRRA